MSVVFLSVLTSYGKQKISEAIANKSQVNVQFMGIGDGNGVEYTPEESQIALKKQWHEVSVNRIELDKTNTNWVIIEGLVPEFVGGNYIREFSIKDETKQDLAIASWPTTYKPVLPEGSSMATVLRMVIEVSNTSAINLDIDQSIALVVRDEFLSHVNNKIDAHSNRMPIYDDLTLYVTKNANDNIAGLVNPFSQAQKAYDWAVANLDFKNVETLTIAFTDGDSNYHYQALFINKIISGLKTVSILGIYSGELATVISGIIVSNSNSVNIHNLIIGNHISNHSCLQVSHTEVLLSGKIDIVALSNTKYGICVEFGGLVYSKYVGAKSTLNLSFFSEGMYDTAPIAFVYSGHKGSCHFDGADINFAGHILNQSPSGAFMCENNGSIYLGSVNTTGNAVGQKYFIQYQSLFNSNGRLTTIPGTIQGFSDSSSFVR